MTVFISSPAYTYSVGAIDVGGLDTYIANSAANLGNSGDQTEVDWVNSKLGSSFTTSDLTKYSVMSWQATNAYQSGIWAINFQTTPEYFYIKTGEISAGQFAGMDHFLFENEAELAWGVINLYFIGTEIMDISKISHVGEMGGVPVPEPMTLLLLGLGLAGTAAVRRFKK